VLRPGRLSFVPLRPPGTTYLVEVTRGRPIDAVACAARHPLSVETYVPADSTPRNLSRVQTVALEREADGVRATGRASVMLRCSSPRYACFDRSSRSLQRRRGCPFAGFLAATNGSRKSEGIRILRDAWKKTELALQ